MDSSRLEDAEALRNLWEEIEAMARDAQRLSGVTARLTHTVRHAVKAYTEGRKSYPRRLLLEIGAALELCRAIDEERGGLEEAMGSLVVSFAPHPSAHAGIEAQARESLRVRVRVRSRPPAQHRP